MPLYRAATLLLLASTACGAIGCRALGVKPSATANLPPVPTLAVSEIVSQHNRNASLVQTLEAMPSVSDRRIGAAQGRMALVRPRDFKLTLSTPTRGTIADMGSNDQQFWFWSAQSEEKAIFVGSYDDTGKAPPDMLFQPDWVVEALGLRLIPPEESQQITTKKGDSPNTIVLVHNRQAPDGKTEVKTTIVDRSTGRVREHDFYGPDGTTLVARALPDDYQPIRLASGETVQLPNRIRLIILPPEEESVVLSIVLGSSSVRVNQFSDQKRAAVFKIPEYDGYAVVDLNQVVESPKSLSSTYDTKPSPPPGGPVRLERPASLTGSEPPSSGNDPLPLSDDVPAAYQPGSVDAVIGARLPRSSDNPRALPPPAPLAPLSAAPGLGTFVER